MYYISMDLDRQALQTNGKLFFKFRDRFLNELHFIKIIEALGLASEVGEAYLHIYKNINVNSIQASKNTKLKHYCYHN